MIVARRLIANAKSITLSAIAEEAGFVTDPMILTPEERAERRRRRREARGRVLDSSIPSPCVSVCTLDPATDWCIGCLRSIDEIRDWPILSAEEKRAVLQALDERRRSKAAR